MLALEIVVFSCFPSQLLRMQTIVSSMQNSCNLLLEYYFWIFSFSFSFSSSPTLTFAGIGGLMLLQ